MFWHKKLAKERKRERNCQAKRNTRGSSTLFGNQGKMGPDLVKLLKAVLRKSIMEETDLIFGSLTILKLWQGESR